MGSRPTDKALDTVHALGIDILGTDALCTKERGSEVACTEALDTKLLGTEASHAKRLVTRDM